MPQYNLSNTNCPEINYPRGLLPQRNNPTLFYQDTSCRSDLTNFRLSSENRRILKRTSDFTFTVIPLHQFSLDLNVQKQIFKWITGLGWDFPINTVKLIFSRHIFNTLYLWKNSQSETIAYSICFFSSTISHIAYVFYDPLYSRTNLPIRLTLQVVIDSHQKGLKFCYLGRFSKDTGYYKRTLPGFEYFQNGQWLKYKTPLNLPLTGEKKYSSRPVKGGMGRV